MSSNSGPFSGELDPDIASLMGISTEKTASKETAETGAPKFNDLFTEEASKEKGDREFADLSKKHFEVITKTVENPKPFFNDKAYYKKVLSGEGEPATKLHQLLTQFLNAEDPQDRSMYRGKLIAAYWDFTASVASKAGRDLPVPKKLLLRYGVVSPSFLSREQRSILSKLILENGTGEPVHYVDEWLRKVASGSVRPSATDEVKQKRDNSNQQLLDKIENRRGQREAELGILRSKILRLDDLEKDLQDQVKLLVNHDTRDDYGGLKDSFNPAQRNALSMINSILHNLSKMDKEINEAYSKLAGLDSEIEVLTNKAEGAERGGSVDSRTVVSEFNTVRQMAKLCVGRQGNHFPILMKQYARINERDIGSRENVINEMAAVEALDNGLFLRTFKGQTNRIVPHVILIASYGDNGICWEPFERFNRATSRGRLAIPMYSKNLKEAVVSALADLRWQVAKEKAQHYWMEEGITGRYFQWFDSQRLRGDVKDYFIRDYILWITKESQGTQKLEREVRGIFWRYIPFPQAVKDMLKNRGFVYNELYKKDINISKSDGY
ncbi:MAG: hypothetical protein J7K04_00070 [Spirochaetales bacterium]|nr:hypothetical protein [Spirochaetales bacterium]